MNLLLICMCCNGSRGSEWAVGWDFICELAKRHNLYVIVAEEDREFVENRKHIFNNKIIFRYISAGWNDNRSDILFFRQIQFNAILNRWHKMAFRVSLEIINNEKIDIVHKLTPCGFRNPGRYWDLGVPSVWGPVTGISEIPLALINSDASFSQKMLLYIKKCTASFDLRYKRSVRKAIKNYSSVIPGSSFLSDKLRKYDIGECPIIIQSGLGDDFVCVDNPLERKFNEPLEIIWVSNMLPRKNLYLVLEGLTFLSDKIRWRLHVVGDGEMLDKSKKMCKDLGLNKKVIFYGKLPREKVFEVMKNCHLFVLLSSYDSSPGVVYEAYGCGLPVICPDYSGFTDVVNEKTGIRVSPVSVEVVCRQFSDAVVDMYENEEKRQSLARNAILQAKKSVYGNKIEVLDKIYNSLLNGV